MKVFLSYGPADQKAATALAEALAAEGFSVWDPATEILPGDNHGRLVGEALEEAEGMDSPALRGRRSLVVRF
ncbi:MAG TPA: TIR domain-containing protein [Verrucomicrobiota bacterium]|nr:TIR domain-containing protein [Verrucomicrobiota bacterium]